MLTTEQKAEIQHEVESRFSTFLTLLRYTQEHIQQQDVQRLEALVRVAGRAAEVLGSSEKALRWLETPVLSLNNERPASLLRTPEGIARVEDALGRIEHGVW